VIPSVNTYAPEERRVRETGSFVVNRHDAGRRRRVRTVELEDVLEMITEDTQINSRTIGNTNLDHRQFGNVLPMVHKSCSLIG